MTSNTPEISVEDRSEKRRLVAAYVQHRLQLECGDDAPRGEASRIAKATGFSTAHVANAKNHGTVGADFAEAMASHWGMTLDGLRAAASEWGSATGFRVDAAAPADARRLRDLPTWPAAAERARLAVDEHRPDAGARAMAAARTPAAAVAACREATRDGLVEADLSHRAGQR